MPFHLELGSGAQKFKGKAIVVNTRSGHHYSQDPIPLEKAQKQMNLLNAVTHSDWRPSK